MPFLIAAGAQLVRMVVVILGNANYYFHIVIF
jgi:hypothetical protein